MSPLTFTMRLAVAGSASTTTTAAPPSPPRVRREQLLDEQRRPPPYSSRVRELLDEQRPRKMMDNLALIIIDQTYSALLEILGPDAPPSGADGHVQISRPVDPADPASPLLSVNASAAHCCISLTDTFYGSGGPDHTNAAASQYRLARATITASPGTLHLARADDGGGRRGQDYWACADARPADVVAGKGLLGVVETVTARLDAAIRLEDTLLGMAKSGGGGCRSPKVREVVEAREALGKMRAAVDLDAIMMRRRRCRRVLIQEEQTGACRRPDADQAFDDGADVLARTLSAVHVGRKRGCSVREMSYCRLPEPDEAEELTKRLKALHV